MKDIDAAYIAGILDGEGCITLSKVTDKTMRNGFAYRPCVSVCNTNAQLVDYLQKTTGVGKVNPRKPCSQRAKPSFVWTVWSQQAANLLMQVLPFLLLKREQAELLVSYAAAAKHRHGVHGLPETVRIYQQDVCDKVRQLNKRGV